MQRYTVAQVEGWVVDSWVLGNVITLEQHERWVAIVNQLMPYGNPNAGQNGRRWSWGGCWQRGMGMTTPRYDVCPECGGQKCGTAATCQTCTQAAQQLERTLVEQLDWVLEDQERDAQARVDAIARSTVPRIARVG